MSGLKYAVLKEIESWKSLIPFGMSGLKSIFCIAFNSIWQSHPVWDEWIEIFLNGTNRYFVHGLIPFGMSGLKYWMCLSTWGRVGLIPFGMSGLKYELNSFNLIHTYSLIPFGMSGLKLSIKGIDSGHSKRLIPFGMSGLKCRTFPRYSPRTRLIPFGMSGLKYGAGDILFGRLESHPVWNLSESEMEPFKKENETYL